MTQRKRLAVARFWYEGNVCLQPAGREDFERREWQRGQAGLDAARGKATELAAVADFQDSRSDWRSALRVAPRPSRPAPCRSRFSRHTWTRCWTIYAASIGTPST